MRPSILQIISIVAVFLLGFCAMELNRQSNREDTTTQTIRVYCSAGFAEPLEHLVSEFNRLSDTKAKLSRAAGSGELTGQIKMEYETGLTRGADIFISADEELIAIAQSEGIVSSAIPIAKQQLVIAVLANNQPVAAPLNLNSLSDLVDQNLRFGIASKTAAAGKLTRALATHEGILDSLETQKTLDAENVMTLAQALMTGSLDAAVIWDTTVMQINQQANKKLLSAVTQTGQGNQPNSNITAGILTKTRYPDECQNLIQFISASKFSREHLQSLGYDAPEQQ